MAAFLTQRQSGVVPTETVARKVKNVYSLTLYRKFADPCSNCFINMKSFAFHSSPMR